MTQSRNSVPILLGCLLLALLMRLPSLDLPLDRDEGEYATLASQWSRGEALPYRDLFEVKPPLVPLLDRAAFAIGGESVLSVRVMALLWQMATAAVFYLLMVFAAGRKAALAATVLAVLASCGARVQGLCANTESFMLLPLMLGSMAIVRRRPEGSAWDWLALGLGVGVASLAKQTALVMLILPLFLAAGSPGLARVWPPFILGAALPWAMAWGYFKAKGAGDAFLFCLFQYGSDYAGQGMASFKGKITQVLLGLGPEQAGLWLLALAAPAGIHERRLKILLALLAAFFLVAFVPGRLYPHYFLPLAFPLAALAGWNLSALWENKTRDWKRAMAVAGLFLFLLGWSATTGKLYLAPGGAERSQRLFGLGSFADAPQAADLVEKADPGGKTLLVWGAEAELYFLCHRKPAFRLLYHYPFTGEAPELKGAREEMMKALKDPANRVFVMAKDTPLRPTDAFQAGLAGVLKEGFDVAGQTRNYVVGTRRPPAETNSRQP